MKNTTVISNDQDWLIELTNQSSDPGSWIVRRWKKVLWFKKRISSDWFLDRDQAMAFAVKMKREPGRRQASRL